MLSPSRPPFPPSDHFDGRLFFNPGVDTDKTILDLLRWQRLRTPTLWPKHLDNPPAAPPPATVASDAMALTFIGQACFLIRRPDIVVLTDPVFSDRASPFAFAGPKRVRAPGVALADLPKIDLVLLSHNHYDHMDLPTLRALHERWRPTIVTGLGNGAYLERKGIPGAIELDWWDSYAVRPGVDLTYVPAQHWSSRTMRDRRRMLWGGFVIDGAPGRLYFAGDSGYFDGFKAIRMRCGAPDVALLPIGAYEPRWFMKSQHMNPEEAVQAHRDLAAGRSLAMHWGTFQLTDEGIEEPVRALEVAKASEALAPEAFLAPLPGETVVVSGLASGRSVA